jgi:hypothetical protein
MIKVRFNIPAENFETNYVECGAMPRIGEIVELGDDLYKVIEIEWREDAGADIVQGLHPFITVERKYIPFGSGS